MSIVGIGAGGALAIIIIRETYSFVKSYTNNRNGGEYIKRSEFDEHKKSVQYKDNCEQIVKRLDEANKSQELRFNSMDKQFDEVKTLIRSGSK